MGSYTEDDLTQNSTFKRQRVQVRNFPTIYDIFQAKDIYGGKMAIRYLSEWLSIHTILIIPTLEEALDLVQAKREASYAYTLFNDRVETNRCQQSGISHNLKAKYFSFDVSGLINETKSKINNIRSNIQELDGKIKELNRQAAEKKKELNIPKPDYDDLLRNIRSEDRKIRYWIQEHDVHKEDDLYYDSEIQDRKIRIEEENRNIELFKRQMAQSDQDQNINLKKYKKYSANKDQLTENIMNLNNGKLI